MERTSDPSGIWTGAILKYSEAKTDEGLNTKRTVAFVLLPSQHLGRGAFITFQLRSLWARIFNAWWLKYLPRLESLKASLWNEIIEWGHMSPCAHSSCFKLILSWTRTTEKTQHAQLPGYHPQQQNPEILQSITGSFWRRWSALICPHLKT